MAYVTAPFIWFITTYFPILPLVIVLDLIGVLTILFVDRLDPRSFVFWLILIIVFPVIGFVLYFSYGSHFYSDHKFRKKALADHGCVNETVDMEGSNSTKLLWNMGEFLDSFTKDIRNTESSVWIETPSMKDSGLWNGILKVLEDAASKGIDVRLMSGTYGWGRTYAVNRFCRAGGRFCTFNNRLYDMFPGHFRNRNLRMLMIIDEKTVYSGYEAVLRIEGPVTSNYIRRFLLDWAHGSGDLRVSVPTNRMDDDVYMVVDGRDTMDPESSMKDILDVVSSARNRLYIATPYLTPDDDFCNTIKLASYSGADVRVLLPGHTWYRPRRWNSLSAAYPLMKAGVRVYFSDEYSTRRMMVSDGRFCMTGSCVISKDSLERDLNLSTVTCSETVCEEAERRFLEELENAVECTAAEYEKRSIYDVLCIAISRFFMFLN